MKYAANKITAVKAGLRTTFRFLGSHHERGWSLALAKISALQRSLIFALMTLTGFCAFGMLSAHDFSDKSDAQLLRLLESNDPSVRVDAALYLGYRYRTP